MEILLWIAAFAAVALGVAGMVLPLLPGTPLLFGGLWLAAWLDGFSKVSVTTVVVLGVMAVLAWLVDYVAAALGVKKVGASKLAMVGAAVGVIAGLPLGLLGIVLGPVVGAMIGEWISHKDSRQSARVGVAAGLSFIVAIAVKLGLAVAMLGVFAFAYFV
jgi:uncharacterized protein